MTAPGNPFTYYCYDLLSGALIGQSPMRAVTFGQQLNQPGTMTATLDLMDPRVQSTNPLGCTKPNRTLVVIDYQGAILWAGIVITRNWKRSAEANTVAALEIQCAEVWAWFQQRIQATDYSAPPSSGITGSMTYWTATPWDPTLIAAQILSDAVAYTDGATNSNVQLLNNGWVIRVNGAAPNAASPVVPALDYVAVNYPFTSMQSVDTIVTQLSQLGLGVGFDFAIDLAYSGGPGTTPVPTINLSYPRRGRLFSQNNLVLDLGTARSYSFPEDGSQTANQVYELGGSGAIVVSANANPLAQGFPLWERVFSRAQAQSANIVQILTQMGLGDLAISSYAPVAPSVTIGMFDTNLPLGSFVIGDDVQVVMQSNDPDGNVFDPRFPAGLSQEWRIIAWQANLPDQGDATVTLTLNQPPFLTALAPAI